MEGDYRFSERMVIDPFNANLVYYGTRCAPAEGRTEVAAPHMVRMHVAGVRD